MNAGLSTCVVSCVSPWSTASPSTSLSSTADPGVFGGLQWTALPGLQCPAPGEGLCFSTRVSFIAEKSQIFLLLNFLCFSLSLGPSDLFCAAFTHVVPISVLALWRPCLPAAPASPPPSPDTSFPPPAPPAPARPVWTLSNTAG